MELIAEINVRNSLAESIIWNAEHQTLWWTDIQSKKLYRYYLHNQSLQAWNTPERLCSFGFTQDPARIVAAFESGFALYDPFNGEIEWLARPELDYRGTRFNDGRVDRQGRFWAGTLREKSDTFDDKGEPCRASIYCLNGSSCRRIIEGVHATNSLCWSEDGTRMYYTDSPTKKIMQAEFDPEKAMPGPASEFASIDGDGFPDGSVIDSEGYLWNAEWRGGRVLRYAPDGRVDRVLQVPVWQPTCVCFAGEHLELLCVSSARDELPAEKASADDCDGNIFIYSTPYKGLQENLFRLGV